MSDETANHVDWRTLSEQTGYRVLTLPSGEAVSASAIAAVRVIDDPHGRRCIIDVKRDGRSVELGFARVTEDVDGFFAMATEAHRRAQTEDR